MTKQMHIEEVNKAITQEQPRPPALPDNPYPLMPSADFIGLFEMGLGA